MLSLKPNHGKIAMLHSLIARRWVRLYDGLLFSWLGLELFRLLGSTGDSLCFRFSVLLFEFLGISCCQERLGNTLDLSSPRL